MSGVAITASYHEAPSYSLAHRGIAGNVPVTFFSSPSPLRPFSLSLCSSRTSYPLCEFLPPPLCSLLLPGSFEAERDADRITLGPCFHSLLWLAININGDVSGWRKKETSCWEAWMTSVYETAPSYRESATTVRLSCRTKIHGAFR